MEKKNYNLNKTIFTRTISFILILRKYTTQKGEANIESEKGKKKTALWRT